jgi:hypothetical protein
VDLGDDDASSLIDVGFLLGTFGVPLTDGVFDGVLLFLLALFVVKFSATRSFEIHSSYLKFNM